MSKGVCIFCKQVIGHRKRSRLLLKHPIWVSGHFIECPGTGCYATPLPDPPAAVDPGSTAAGNEVTPAACLDCGLPYINFPLDVNLPRAQWLAIHPEGEGGLLCAGCLVQRIKDRIPGATVVHAVAEVAPWPLA